MAIQVRWGSATHVGCVRSMNQDAVLAGPTVFAVADGMGGHAAGEVASAITITHMADLEAGCSAEDLLRAVSRANTDVVEQGAPGGPRAGMGTTLSGLALVAEPEGDAILVFNVGDSRTFEAVDGRLVQLTEDHSLVAEMVRDGELSPESAEHHRARNVVTRALGVSPELEVDSWVLRAEVGHAYLVCSDGLTNEVSFDDIEAALGSAATPQEIADELVRQALDAGARDNVSVVVVYVDAVDDASPTLEEDTGRRRVASPPPSASPPPADAPTPGDGTLIDAVPVAATVLPDSSHLPELVSHVPSAPAKPDSPQAYGADGGVE